MPSLTQFHDNAIVVRCDFGSAYLQFSISTARLTALVASMDVCTLWHQQAIRVKEPVEQRGSRALSSRVTPAANETPADLGLCGCVD